MPDFGPIFGIFLNWQSLLVLLVSYYMTQGFKRALDFAVGGEERRKSIRWITAVLLPGLPAFVGALVGAIVPYRPETLVAYRPQHWTLYASWGLVLGLFADLTYQKIQHYLRSKNMPTLPTLPTSTPSVPKPIAPAAPDPAPEGAARTTASEAPTPAEGVIRPSIPARAPGGSPHDDLDDYPT